LETALIQKSEFFAEHSFLVSILVLLETALILYSFFSPSNCDLKVSILVLLETALILPSLPGSNHFVPVSILVLLETALILGISEAQKNQ